MRANFPISAKVNDKGHLEIGGVDVLSLAKEFGTPLYIIDEKTLRDRCQQYKNAFRSKYQNFQIVYASKALSTTGVLKIIEDEGLGVDVVSGGELYTALKAGCKPKNIYFHGNSKSAKEIEEALRAGIGRIVVDNIFELKKLNEITLKTGIRADILFRVNPGIEAHTHEFIQTGRVDSKFGIAKENVVDAVKLSLEMKNISFKGLHAHIGSQILDISPFAKLAEILLSLSKNIISAGLSEVEEINIGGGLGVCYTDEIPPDINALADLVCKTVKSKCLELKIAEPKLILEPGRSIISTAGVTVYTINGIKDIPGIRKYAFIDGGMGDNIRPVLYQARYDAVLGNKINSNNDEKVTVAGRYCESGDIVLKDVSLPKIETGDVLAVLCTGAYNYSMASNYNRVGRPAMVLVGDGDASLIVKRESYEDLTLNDVLVK